MATAIPFSQTPFSLQTYFPESTRQAKQRKIARITFVASGDVLVHKQSAIGASSKSTSIYNFNLNDSGWWAWQSIVGRENLDVFRRFAVIRSSLLDGISQYGPLSFDVGETALLIDASSWNGKGTPRRIQLESLLDEMNLVSLAVPEDYWLRDRDYLIEGDFLSQDPIAVGQEGYLFTYEDYLVGTEYDDTILGYRGNDTLEGKNGADEMHGGYGNDKLLGGDGNDVLYGDQGDDTLIGGLGHDELIGGAGKDLFRFASSGGEGNDNDRIIDFRSGHDKISIIKSGFKIGGRAINRVEVSNSPNNNFGSTANFHFNTSTNELFFKGQSASFATVFGVNSLSNLDFVM